MLFQNDVQSVGEHIQPDTAHDVVHFIALWHSGLNRGKPAGTGQPLENLIYPVLDQIKTVVAPQSMPTHHSGLIPLELIEEQHGSGQSCWNYEIRVSQQDFPSRP